MRILGVGMEDVELWLCRPPEAGGAFGWRRPAPVQTVAKMRENPTLSLCHATHRHSQVPVEGLLQQSPVALAAAQSSLSPLGRGPG